MSELTQAARDVLAKREEHRATAGDAHDDTLTDGVIIEAAAGVLALPLPHPRARLVLATALLLAEIERLDRVPK